MKSEKVIVLGLSDNNMEKLKANQPIKFNLREFGAQMPDMDVFIFNGRDEVSMMREFKQYIGPSTRWGGQEN